MPVHPHLFNAAKILQTDINAWKTCTHKKCAEKQACLGGPRGTCRRTGGWPLCTGEARGRMADNKQTKWQRNAAYENETTAERALRRQESRMAEMREEMLMADINTLVANIRQGDER